MQEAHHYHMHNWTGKASLKSIEYMVRSRPEMHRHELFGVSGARELMPKPSFKGLIDYVRSTEDEIPFVT